MVTLYSVVRCVVALSLYYSEISEISEISEEYKLLSVPVSIDFVVADRASALEFLEANLGANCCSRPPVLSD